MIKHRIYSAEYNYQTFYWVENAFLCSEMILLISVILSLYTKPRTYNAELDKLCAG